ncbi:sensor histidine kinase [Microbacterium sp. NPDC057407]|uniref:sensor histidine kinase n=1 Tax=Microbacterium sp. NPDC057407 TaxID=3346120 RepID=UPI0036720F3A
MASGRWRSVRARTTLWATLVVAVAVGLGAVAFYAVLDAGIRAGAERSAELRLDELSSRIEDGGPRAVADLDDEVAVVVSDDGRILAASDEAQERTWTASDEPQVVTVDDEPVLVVAEELDGDGILLVGVSLDDDRATLATVAGLLAVAVPTLTLLVALLTWWVVGRALRPVERIRENVEKITAERLDRRVPVPDSGDEIATLAVTMNGMLDRLDASARAQRRFVSDASHELRSPLATIRQHAELAIAHPESTSVRQLADVVHDEGLRLQGLVDALLLLSRLDEGGRSGEVQDVDLDDIALGEVTRLRTLGLQVDGSGVGAARVRGDARMIGQLVRNLTDNAARHSRGRVAISVTTRDGVAMLTVEDDGDGIPPAERDRVFERFVRLDEARARDAGGSGLGLSIVRGVAEAARGTVAVTESRWGGARFAVTLPAAS